MARQAWTGFKKLDYRFMDGLRHKIAREHLSNEQLQHVRVQDAERHRISLALGIGGRRRPAATWLACAWCLVFCVFGVVVRV